MPNRPDLMQDYDALPLPLTDPVSRHQRVQITIDFGEVSGTVLDVAHFAVVVKERLRALLPGLPELAVDRIIMEGMAGEFNLVLTGRDIVQVRG